METLEFRSEFMQLISLTYSNHLRFWLIYDTICNMTALHLLCNAIKCCIHIRDDKLRQKLDYLVCLQLYRKSLNKLGIDQLDLHWNIHPHCIQIIFWVSCAKHYPSRPYLPVQGQAGSALLTQCFPELQSSVTSNNFEYTDTLN